MHDHDRGLSHDLPRLLSRRAALGTLMAGGLGVVLTGCGADDDRGAQIREEAAGPFPGDGSNGPNVLAESGVVRRDITRSIGGASGVANGVPTTVALTLIDVAGGGPLAGAAVYLWHCTAAGRYSLYEAEAAAENYLRGVQESDADGRLAFDTVFPGAYAGRWPHMHFEVYESPDAAIASTGKLRTSQLAIPQEACDAAFATDGYEQSVRNLKGLSLESDIVFADRYAGQLATATGSVEEGFTLTLNVGV